MAYCFYAYLAQELYIGEFYAIYEPYPALTQAGFFGGR